MSFKFEFKIDYAKLTALLDTFLKEHSAELTSIMGKCLVLEPSSGNSNSNPPQQQPPAVQPIIQAPSDHTVDNRPLIGDSIPEDPFSNMFSNSDTTRYKDRNNPNIKKGYRD